MTRTDGPRETSSATTRLVLAWVREARGDDAVARVLAAADVPETREQLEDDSAWVSYATRIALFEAIAAEFGDPHVLFQIGGSLLRQSVNPSMAVLLRALGSPAQVYRAVPRAVAKFSTTSTMRVVEVGATHATVDFRLHEGYTHSALDCLYAQGLLTTVPSLFGLPAARVVHPECEQDGAPACRYSLTWERRSRLRRRREETGQVSDLRAQLEALQSAASDLAGSADVQTVLRRITERAASTVLATGYLLTVTPAGSDVPLVESVGLSTGQRDALAARLLAGEDLGPSAVVVDVASPRHRHGYLAALYAEGQRGLPDERRLLAAYAGHAAAALDLLTALEDSRRDEERAKVLLGLSHELSRATSTEHVAELVAAALPRVVACDSAGVLLWDPSAGLLRRAASWGLSADGAAALDATPLRPQDLPELTEMLTVHEPMVVSAGTAAPGLRQVLDALEIEHLVAVPLAAGGDLLGVATASWRSGPAPAERTSDLTLRLQGVADQAATALRNAQLLQTVRHQALHDALTGLPNRVLFADRLEQAVAAGGAAVLFCDLDRFKQVNDVLGHAAGDELLRQVALRLQAAVTGGSVGRLSGDEFAVLLPGADQPRAEEVAAAVVACFERPFRLEGREMRVTTSVGVAQGGPADSTADRLLRAADTAMYVAKQRGRNQVCSASHDAAAPAHPGPSLALELREGIARDELRLVFQPVVALPSREVVGVEALVRWEHPRLGQLPPSAFLPLAEEAGVVVELDLWVLRAATCAVAQWEGGPQVVAVNLSGATLVDPRLLGAAREALAASGLPPERLSVEVVESRSLVDLPGVVDRLAALRRLGVGIALDDFGTGYSTLSLLQQLPATSVKVDRSFVAALGQDPQAASLVRGVLALARALELEVVAEGVETEEQLALLQAEGCTLVQGYLLGRPAPAPALATAAR